MARGTWVRAKAMSPGRKAEITAACERLVAEMKAQGWSRLYWNTKENNYRARGLYDKYTPHSGFLRYVVVNPEAPG